MRRWGFLGCAALVLSACAQLAPQEALPSVGSRPIAIGTQHAIHSNVYGELRTINVQVPAEYGDTETPPNVLFVLDGGLGQDFQHIAGLGQLASLSWTMEPMLVVGVESQDRRNEFTAPAENTAYLEEFPTSGGAEKFRAFLEQDVMPFVQANYRTGGRTALMGESLAGLFVVDTFLTRRDLFDDYISVSPSLWWDDQHLVKSAAPLLRKEAPGLRRLYLTIGDEGGAMQAGMDKLRAALEANPRDHTEWLYRDQSEDETHATIYHGSALEALRWLYATPPYDYGETPWYYLEENERDALNQ